MKILKHWRPESFTWSSVYDNFFSVFLSKEAIILRLQGIFYITEKMTWNFVT